MERELIIAFSNTEVMDNVHKGSFDEVDGMNA